MEATEHKYSNEELVTLIKIHNNKELNQYYYELLYKNNYSLFHKLSWKYSNVSWCYDIQDLLQECHLAMVKAVEYYNSKTDTPFFNFLFRITNQHIFSIVNNGATTKEKAEKKKIAYVSLYEVLHEDKEGETQELIDTIADEEAQRMIDEIPEVAFLSDLLKAEKNAIDTLLSNREAECIKLYYGFDSIPFNTVEIAEMLGVNRARVNECLHNAYRKLRRDKELKKFWETEFAWK